MNLTFVISSMTCGGAQRVMSIVANEFARRGFRVTILTLNDEQVSFYPLETSVTLIPLSLYGVNHGLTKKVIANLRRTHVLRRALRDSDPDVVLSFGDKTNVLTLSSGFIGAPIVVSERVNPDFWDIGPFWNGLRNVVYLRASRIIVQANDIAEVAKKWGRPLSVIPNPIRTDLFPEWVGGKKQIIAAGRMVPQKGYDFLISAFEQVALDRPEWTLEIYGNGKLRDALHTQVEAAGLSGRVNLHDSTPDIFDVFSHAEMFVLSSRFEGYPNVLIEAMACGLGCIAFDCPSGPADILNEGNGQLVSPVGDVEKLGMAMADYMDNPELRHRVGRRAKISVQPLQVEKNIALWMDALGMT